MYFSIINLGACIILRHVCTRACSSLTIDSCIRGYHEYSAIWEPVMGEELQCGRKVDNLYDPYAVNVLKRRQIVASQIVGHIPRSISRPCSVLLRGHGSISKTFLQVLQ